MIIIVIIIIIIIIAVIIVIINSNNLYIFPCREFISSPYTARLTRLNMKMNFQGNILIHVVHIQLCMLSGHGLSGRYDNSSCLVLSSIMARII